MKNKIQIFVSTYAFFFMLLCFVSHSLLAGKGKQDEQRTLEPIYCQTFCEGEFQEIEFAGTGAFNVNIQYDNSNNCIICADENWLPKIQIKIEQNRLHISAPKEMPKNKKIECAIFTNLIKLVLAKDNADVYIKKEIKNNSLQLLTFGKSKISTKIQLSSLEAIAVDSSQIIVSGKAEHQKINLEYAAYYNGERCEAESVDVNAQGNSLYRGFITKDDDVKNVATISLRDNARGLLRGKIHRLVYSCEQRDFFEMVGLVAFLEKNIKIAPSNELLYQRSENVFVPFKSEALIKAQEKKKKLKMKAQKN